jgi:hypothetical protein
MDDQLSLICSIKVGEIIINLICPSIDYAKGMREYFNAGAEDHPDIEIQLEITAEKKEITIPESLFNTKTVCGTAFSLTGGCAEGEYHPGTGKGWLRVHYLLTSSLRTRLFEQLLYQAFYSAVKKRNDHALLIHSCGVIHKKSGYLFVGKSGSGKSTVAELSSDKRVLNDEIILIDMKTGKPVIYSTPFNGYFKEKKTGCADLKGIFLLEQADTHSLTGVKKSSAVKSLFQEIVPVIGLEEEMTGNTHAIMLDYAAILAREIPVYTLKFLPDPGFWEVIERDMTNVGVYL